MPKLAPNQWSSVVRSSAIFRLAARHVRTLLNRYVKAHGVELSVGGPTAGGDSVIRFSVLEEASKLP